jgi:hypothetical protein
LKSSASGDCTIRAGGRAGGRGSPCSTKSHHLRALQYLHHAKAIIHKPYHTGFFFKIWDQLFGSIYTGECLCCKSVRAHGMIDSTIGHA